MQPPERPDLPPICIDVNEIGFPAGWERHCPDGRSGRANMRFAAGNLYEPDLRRRRRLMPAPGVRRNYVFHLAASIDGADDEAVIPSPTAVTIQGHEKMSDDI